ncbi:uncharacterized protein M6B38_309390 [Iris pallida]|uniref:Stress-response A/B barrel domain-containing protein n=1 Tax=Iris pallida TaxID=29817 RepID=A0AAX6HIQ1_IRIPA|nr:uncharacterized protein M6B38_309390 [Iris pallida]
MLLSVKTFPFLHRHPLVPKSRSFSTTMAHQTPATVEHVVLFKVRESVDPAAMLSGLRSLTSLNLATHLSAGPVLRPLRSSAAADLGFTHLLHSRYPSKDDLSLYAAHPDHVLVVNSHVIPSCDDVMAVDWVSHSPSLPPPPPGSALRLTFAKPKQGSSAAQLLDAIADAAPAAAEGGRILQLSYGENFSPARAKGYEVGMIAVFPGVEDLEKASEETEAAKEKVRPLLESVIVLDYVVPEGTASL